MEEVRFAKLESALTEHIQEMTKDVKSLFVVDADKDYMWSLYLRSFPEGTNPICRVRTEHDCSACRHFIKAFGNVVAIRNNRIVTIWDFEAPGRYGPVALALSDYVRACAVNDVFVTKDTKFGTKLSHEVLDNGSVATWEHLYTEIPTRISYKGNKTLDSVRGELHSIRDVFKRSLDEISKDAVSVVLELIGQNSLYKGEEWKSVLETFKVHQVSYSLLPECNKDLYCWEHLMDVGPVIGKIRNHSIGVLLVAISNGMDLDEAVRQYEAIVAPSHYKRPKPIVSARMIEDAEKTINSLGLMGSLPRRHATLSDITVNNILFADRDATKVLASSNIFDSIKKELPVNPKAFSKTEEVSLSDFITNVLPNANGIEVFLENDHTANLVSLIAPVNRDALPIFKWDNGFSWAYSGNMTDSMKQRVKSLGGKIDGVLRFSIQWNTEGDNNNDFDAHCIEPKGDHIFFASKRFHKSGGELDVDIIQPMRNNRDDIAVENITWASTATMPEGKYQFFVHNYNHRGGRSGFTAEVEFNGNIYSFAYNKELRRDEKVPVAEVTYSKKTGFSIKEMIPSSLSSRKLWNLDSNKFHPVSVVMMSPNYWDGQTGIGNRHIFFMLKGCINDESPNGFFNEYLRNELIEHRRVFELLGSKMRVEHTTDQLSGIGFSTTQRSSVIVKVTGHTSRTIKVII